MEMDSSALAKLETIADMAMFGSIKNQWQIFYHLQTLRKNSELLFQLVLMTHVQLSAFIKKTVLL